MADPEPNKPENFETLVRYSVPVMVLKRPEHILKSMYKDMKRPKSAGDTIVDSKAEVEEILNAILPPRCWEEDGQLWQQSVSTTPATCHDVIRLQEMLDTRLRQSQARETGVCPIRRELYGQCLDEIIRQETISLSERGLVLLRLRDEINMVFETYEILGQSSVRYGMTKALEAHERKIACRDNLRKLERETQLLEESVTRLQSKTEKYKQHSAESRAEEEKRNADEEAALKKTQTELKMQLDGILGLHKKSIA